MKNFWGELKTKNWLALIVLLALGLRLYGINWDAGQHLHPDERYMTMVTTAIKWPESLGEYLDPQCSPLSPYNTDYKAYIYGTFPLFWVKATAGLIGADSYGQLHLVGRFWSAIFDVGTLLLVFWIGKKIFDERTGLIASALYAVTVLAIQQSHFFTVDNFATFWLMVSFAVLLRTVLSFRLLQSGILGIAFGLAVASKISSLLFGGVIGMGFLLGWVGEIRGIREIRGALRITGAYLALGLVFAVASYATFRLAQPYAFASASWFDLTPQPDFWQALSFQRKAMTGEVMFPPQYQWVGTAPFWFPLKNLLLWGLGPVLGVASLAGIALLLYKLLKFLKNLKGQETQTTVVLQTLPLAWVLGLFLYQGGSFVKSMRYLLPLVPFLSLAAAYALSHGHTSSWLQEGQSKPVGFIFARLSLIGALAGSLLWALAYVNIYSTDTTRVAASRWLYENVPAGSVLANEHWDDPLPLILSAEEAQNSKFEIRNYETFPMEVYDPDLDPKGLVREQKLRDLYADLTHTDHVILSSPRASDSIGQLPERFPLMARYYAALDAGTLGFQQVAKITSYPNLLGVTINDESAEEAFRIYDHPTVRIYQKVNLPSYDRFASLLTISTYH